MFNERNRLNRRIDALEGNAAAKREPEHPWGISVTEQIQDTVDKVTSRARELRRLWELGEGIPLPAEGTQTGGDLAAIRASFREDGEVPEDIAAYLDEHVGALVENAPEGVGGPAAVRQLHEQLTATARRRLEEES